MNAVQMIRVGRMLMATMHREAFCALWHDESGQDLLEFALVAALLSLCAVATTQTLAARVENLWGYVSNNLATDLGK